MIDRVQQILEGLAPEMDDYSKRKIFTRKEISKIIETRRTFENKLQRSQKKLEDFLQYIESEKKLEKVRNRRILLARNTHAGTEDLLPRNILSIYTKALHHFTEPILMKEFSEFCIRRKFYEEMKKVFLKTCLRRLGDSDLWIYCAQKLWEVNDIESARNMFLQCTGVNRDRRLLVEFFRLECAYSERINELNRELGIEEEDKDEIEKGEVAFVIFKSLYPVGKENEIEECIGISSVVPGLTKYMQLYIDSKKN